MKPGLDRAIDRSGEVACLLEIARLGPRGSPSGAFALLAQDIDWDAFEALAARHHLVPLSFAVLRRLSPCPTPRESLARLWKQSEEIANNSLRLAKELDRVLGAFLREGVGVVPFKGPVLAEAVYGDVGLRQFRDLDLLVSPGELASATRVLLRSGYQLAHDLDESAVSIIVGDPACNQLLFYCEETDSTLELHWRTDSDAPVGAIEDPDWWRTRPKIQFQGREILVLSHDEEFLALCLHGTKHFWESLHWLVDVSALARNPSLDWPAMLARAEALGARRRFAVAIVLLEDLLGAALPPQASAWARSSPGAMPLARELVEAMFRASKAPMGALWRCRVNLALYDLPGSKARFLWKTLFAPSVAELERWRPRSGTRYFYPALRVYRLTAKYLSLGLHRLRGPL